MEHFDLKSTSAQLEALLFVKGEPMSLEKAIKILALNNAQMKEVLAHLREEYSHANRGLMLIEHNQTIQLVTKKECADMLHRATTEEVKEDLSPALLETLAIVAYHGPVSRAQIEHIRGIQSSLSLRNLALRGLIVKEESALKNTEQRYLISSDFLRHLGFATIDQLPEYAEYRKKVKEKEQTQNSNIHDDAL